MNEFIQSGNVANVLKNVLQIKARCAWKGRSTGCFPKAYKACEENAWRTSREMHGLPFAKHMAYEIGNIRQSRLLPGPTNQDTI